MRSKWTALAIGLAMGFDIVGTPLAVLSIDRANQFSHDANQAVVHSRYEDCVGQEKLRKLGRERVEQKIHEIPNTLKLLHLEPTPHLIRLSVEAAQAELVVLAPVNCTAYANKAKA